MSRRFWVRAGLVAAACSAPLLFLARPAASLIPEIVDLNGHLTSGESVFAPFLLHPRDLHETSPRRGLLRWNDSSDVVVQLDGLRLTFDGTTLWEDDGGGPVAMGPLATLIATQLVGEIQSGFANSTLASLSPGDVPGFSRHTGLDYVEVDLPMAWASSNLVFLGFSQVTGKIREVVLTEIDGTPMVLDGHTMRLAFGDLSWDVELAPDMVDPTSIPLSTLGERTVFSDDAPLVLEDLPWHERMQRHPLLLSKIDSTGYDPGGLPRVVSVDLRDVACSGAGSSVDYPSTLVWQTDPTDPSHAHLTQAIADQCTLAFWSTPRAAYMLDAGVAADVDVSGEVRTGAGALLGSATASYPEDGQTRELRQPVLFLPFSSTTADLEVTLDIDLSVACDAGGVEGSVWTYFADIAQPVIVWDCS